MRNIENMLGVTLGDPNEVRDIVGKKTNGQISKTGVLRKQSWPNFQKNEHFLSPDKHTYALLPYYRRYKSLLLLKVVG